MHEVFRLLVKSCSFPVIREDPFLCFAVTSVLFIWCVAKWASGSNTLGN